MSTTQKSDVMEVQLSREEGVAVLTINNPSRKNALSPPVLDDLLRHLTAMVNDKSCRAIVLTGGTSCFCAGGDVRAMQNRANEGNELIARRLRFTTMHHPMMRMMIEGPKPVVTAVEGVAFGGGLALAVASDYTVVANNARFCAAQILRGVCPDMGLYYLLTARTGPGRARELLLTGREFKAAEAEKYGVAHEVTEPGEALAAAMRMARHFASLPPLPFAFIKAAMTQSYQSLDSCYRAENDYQPVVALSRDHKESVAAFIEKRKPEYKGE